MLTFNDLPHEISLIRSELAEIKELFRLQKSNTPDDNEKLLSIVEAAKFLGVSVPTVYGYIYKNCIPHMKPSGKKVYFSQEELRNWLKSSKRKTNDELKSDADNLTCKPKKERKK